MTCPESEFGHDARIYFERSLAVLDRLADISSTPQTKRQLAGLKQIFGTQPQEKFDQPVLPPELVALQSEYHLMQLRPKAPGGRISQNSIAPAHQTSVSNTSQYAAEPAYTSPRMHSQNKPITSNHQPYNLADPNLNPYVAQNATSSDFWNPAAFIAYVPTVLPRSNTYLTRTWDQSFPTSVNGLYMPKIYDFDPATFAEMQNQTQKQQFAPSLDLYQMQNTDGAAHLEFFTDGRTGYSSNTYHNKHRSLLRE